MNLIKEIYDELLKSYGQQGWWPLINHKGLNPTKTGSIRGYHPGNYDIPSTQDENFEVCIGSILTQNTSWVQVEKALKNLSKCKILNPKAISKCSEAKLKECIKPSGYFNHKARKIKEFTNLFLTLNGRTPTREELLSIWGIGNETADSMLLYAFKVPSFVVDAYTRRIFENLNLLNNKMTYDQVKQVFEDSLEKDLIVYQEYHALIVEHAKRHYLKKSEYHNCPLLKLVTKMGGIKADI